MFNTNKYTRLYFKIIDKAISEDRNKLEKTYYESHHIIPRSLNGSNDITNLVLLTFKEHYICHRLLCKMTDGNDTNKMKYALYMLCKSSKGQERNMSFHQRMKCLESNRQASRTRNHKPHLGHLHSDETKELLRQKSSGRKHTKEAKDKISKANVITNISRGTKVKAFLTGRPKSEEHKKNISEAIKKRNREKMVGNIGIEPMTSSV